LIKWSKSVNYDIGIDTKRLYAQATLFSLVNPNLTAIPTAEQKLEDAENEVIIAEERLEELNKEVD